MRHNAPMSVPPKRRLTWRRIAAAGVVIVVIVGGVRILTTQMSTLREPVNPILPDLVMGPIEEVTGGLEEFTSNPVARVEATIVNNGVGPFLVSARRDFPWSEHWTVFQQLLEYAGGRSERATPADLIFTGAPHSHWHVLNMEAHRLEDRDTGEVLSEVIKQGFCPYDTDEYYPDRAGAPADPAFLESDCEGPAWVTSLKMGVSIGWGDKYPWHMVEQSIDIGGVPDGTYRIREIADPFNWFLESDETNNETCVDVEIVNKGGIPTVTLADQAPQPSHQATSTRCVRATVLSAPLDTGPLAFETPATDHAGGGYGDIGEGFGGNEALLRPATDT